MMTVLGFIVLLLFGIPVLMVLPAGVRWGIAVLALLTAFPPGIVVFIQAAVAECAVRQQ